MVLGLAAAEQFFYVVALFLAWTAIIWVPLWLVTIAIWAGNKNRNPNDEPVSPVVVLFPAFIIGFVMAGGWITSVWSNGTARQARAIASDVIEIFDEELSGELGFDRVDTSPGVGCGTAFYEGRTDPIDRSQTDGLSTMLAIELQEAGWSDVSSELRQGVGPWLVKASRGNADLLHVAPLNRDESRLEIEVCRRSVLTGFDVTFFGSLLGLLWSLFVGGWVLKSPAADSVARRRMFAVGRVLLGLSVVCAGWAVINWVAGLA